MVRGPDGKRRCRWGDSDDRYRAYHDTEWGRPVLEEQGLYERLCLELMQSGLSWSLILRKRDGLREAFAGFDPEAVVGLEVKRLLKDEAVIRNRAKLEAIVQNAKRVTLAMRDDVAAARADLELRARRPRRAPRSYAEMVSFSPESKELAKSAGNARLRVRRPDDRLLHDAGAVGVANDHLAGCFVRAEVEAARRAVLHRQRLRDLGRSPRRGCG